MQNMINDVSEVVSEDAAINDSPRTESASISPSLQLYDLLLALLLLLILLVLLLLSLLLISLLLLLEVLLLLMLLLVLIRMKPAAIWRCTY